MGAVVAVVDDDAFRAAALGPGQRRELGVARAGVLGQRRRLVGCVDAPRVRPLSAITYK